MFSGIGAGFLIVGVVMLVLGLIWRLMANKAMKVPPVHDGVGGEDSKRLAGGCMTFVAGVLFLYAGGAIALVGLVITVIARL